MKAALAALLVPAALADPTTIDRTAPVPGGPEHEPAWTGNSSLLDTALAPEFPEDRWALGMEVPSDLLVTPPAQDPKWLVRLEYGWSTANSLGEFASGEFDVLSNNEAYLLTVGRYLKRDLFGWPMDLSLNATVGFHPSNSNQDDIFQFIFPWVQLQWYRFPWSDHLRTRIALGEGLSYVTEIPYAEQVRRDFRPSNELLNHLQLSLSFNMADLCRVTRLERILPSGSRDALENTWLLGALHHRSGGGNIFGDVGIFGNYRDSNGKKQGITGGLNMITIGIQSEF